MEMLKIIWKTCVKNETYEELNTVASKAFRKRIAIKIISIRSIGYELGGSLCVYRSIDQSPEDVTEHESIFSSFQRFARKLCT